MNVEIEAKLKVDSLKAVAEKLDELGAEFLEEQLQKDYYFDDADRMLTKTDKALRLRCQSVGGQEKLFLTWKGPKESDNFKKRQEIEFEITDADAAEKFLSALGYVNALVIEKKRRIWKLGGCVVALDELPLLGEFVEIEGPDDEKIAKVQNNLALAELKHIPKSYACLITEKLVQPEKE